MDISAYGSGKAKNTDIEELIERLSKGDTDALEELYSATSDGVFAYALSILRSIPDAEDAMQDTYLKIASTAHRYIPQGKPMAWILTCAKNMCLMKLRERKRRAETPIEGNPDALKSDDDGLSRIEDALMIEAFMKELSPEENSIVVLHAVAGLKHRETAKLMGMPLSTVLSKYRRALEKLRKHITLE